MKTLRWIGVLGLALLAATPGSAKPGEAATVTVVGPDGSPLAGATVHALAPMENAYRHPCPVARGETDAEGKVRLKPAPAERINLWVKAPEAKWKKIADVRVEAWKTRDVTVRLPTAGRAAGCVVTPSGKPAPYARVMIRPVPGPRSGSGPDFLNGHLQTWADGKGRFVFERVPVVHLTIEAAMVYDRESGRGPFDNPSSGHVSFRPGGKDLVLKLDREPTGPGELVCVRAHTEDGRQVWGGTAAFDNRKVYKQGSYTSATGSAGGSVFEDYCADEQDVDDKYHSVEISNPKDEAGVPLPFGPARTGAIGPGAADVTLRLPKGLRVSGRVLGPDDEPAPRVRVQAIPARKDPMKGLIAEKGRSVWADRPVHGETWTAEDGTFEIVTLGREEYRLRTQPNDRYFPLDAVHTRAGAEDVVVRVDAAARPLVRVVDWQGQPVEGARIRIYQMNRNFWDRSIEDRMPSFHEPQTDAKGEHRLEGLSRKGVYQLSVDAPRKRHDTRSLTIEKWSPEDLTITLPRGYVVSGQVVDPDGSPVPKARVHYTGEGKSSGTVLADEEGRFTIGRLPEGKVGLLGAPPPGPETGPGRGPRAPGGRPEPPIRKVAVKGRKPKLSWVKAGEGDLRLEMRLPSVMRVRIANWSRDHGGLEAFLVAEEGEQAGKVRKEKVGRDGGFVFEDIEWGTPYTLLVGPAEDGRSAGGTGLRVPEEGAELEIDLRPGQTIRGRLTSKDRASRYEVVAVLSGIEVDGTVERDGRFEVRGLPRGRYRLVATARKGAVILEGTAEAEAGARVDVELLPKEE